MPDFQALWIEVCFVKQKNLECGIVYRQHNLPEKFQSYIDETIEKFISSGKTMSPALGDTNLDLMKSARCKHTNEFLSTLMSCHLIPTVDKPTRVYKKSATLIDNIFVSNPEDVLLSGNIVSDITDHFSQVCLLSSSKEFHGVKSKKARDFSSFSVDQFKTAISTINWINIIGKFGTDVNRAFSI